MAILGYERHLEQRWKQEAEDPKTRSIQMHQLLASCKMLKKIYVKREILAEFRRRADAEAMLLNLRMQNRLLIVEDWLDKRGTYDRLE